MDNCVSSEGQFRSYGRTKRSKQGPALDAPAKIIRNNKALMRKAADKRTSQEEIKREKSRISAKQCRERKNLRYGYLKDFVDDAEEKVLKLRAEFDHLALWARKLTYGVVDPELIRYRYLVERNSSPEMFGKNVAAIKRKLVGKDMAAASGNVPRASQVHEECFDMKIKSTFPSPMIPPRRRCKAVNTNLALPSISEILEPQECVKQEFKEVLDCDMQKDEDILTGDAQESCYHSVIPKEERLNNDNVMSFLNVGALVNIPRSAQDQTSVWEIESIFEDFGEGEKKEKYCSLVLVGDTPLV